MCEVENNVRVSVKGPKEEIETYIHWLKCTEEYHLKSGFKKTIPASKFSLTDFNLAEEAWKFTSTDMRHQIRAFHRWNLKELNYQVNYMVYYGTQTLTNGALSTIKVEDYEHGVFQELVKSFNPIPPMLANKCPNLQIELTWGSYYLEQTYSNYSFEGDQAI